MIQKENLKDLLTALDFREKGGIFTKYFPDLDTYLSVDFPNKTLIYPIEKGFKVNGAFTCNFSSDENFVVFECVNRLLSKGYKPEHIELEPKWKVGHGASGGRADILVKDNTDKALLIIECKTEGYEFKKEWNNTLQRGGQMLTYAKQAGSTQYVCLYASDFIDGKVLYDNYIISVKDNEKLLAELKDKKPLSFAEAKALEVEDIYKAWKETYHLDFATKGIFEDDIQAYHIGKQKYAIADLSQVGSKDIQSKYHEFATILRQHNVSGRENAFDKLVNLFLCKIVDESKNPQDLKFYWKGIAYDSYFDLQDRLQLLYQVGMKDLLGEEVTYINTTDIKNAFKYVKNDPDATQETILGYFWKQKFYTNNDFAFIDVHNENLFYQNAEVLLKVLRMLQDTQLKTEKQNQFLGDMFEGFLDQGVKQSEGQFFTPMPIVKFILNSLPLESLVKDHELPPKALDYACGAGHFLNELALQIKPFVLKHKQTDIKEYYEAIVGIEKEYRLSKVAKVSAFMYGQNEINIRYADALGEQAKLHENEYSILVANPPYSVKGFLQTLSAAERNRYSLMATVDEKSLANNNSIETFFIERAKQLLKPGAVAGIVLPSSILSNDSNIYIKTREILLQYFDIVAIVEFGSQTFGKTGTNTVTLFLRRKAENPAPADHYKYRVAAWFKDNEAEVVYQDAHFLQYYCHHIGIEMRDYETLLRGNLCDELLATEIFTAYQKSFDNLTDIKNLKKQKIFTLKPKSEQEIELKKRFKDYVQSIEKDKLLYFVLALENEQKVLIVKSPQDNKEQKQFLGYEWSSAKGHEGIKYINQTALNVDIDDAETKEVFSKLKGLHHINTPLYDPANRENDTKINFLIQQNFLGNEVIIPQNLQANVSHIRLVDMLRFKTKTFNKQIFLNAEINTTLPTKWEVVKLGDVVTAMGGLWTGKKAPFKAVNVIRNTNFKKGGKLDLADVANIEVEVSQFENRQLRKGDIIIEKSGGSETQAVGRVILFDLEDENYSFSNFTARLRPDNEQISSNFLHLYLNYFYELGLTFHFQSGSSGLKNLDLNRYLDIKIPLPPPNIQAQIVAACEAIDADVLKAAQAIAKNQQAIEAKIREIYTKNYATDTLGNLADIKNGGTPDTTNPAYWYNGEIRWATLVDTKNKYLTDTARKITQEGINKSSAVLLPINTVIFSSRATIGEVTIAKVETCTNQGYKNFICYADKINYEYLYYILKFEAKNIENLANGMTYLEISKSAISEFKIPVPPLPTQVELVAAILALESQKQAAESVIAQSSGQKKAVMRQYL